MLWLQQSRVLLEDEVGEPVAVHADNLLQKIVYVHKLAHESLVAALELKGGRLLFLLSARVADSNRFELTHRWRRVQAAAAAKYLLRWSLVKGV
jgi:hypothetical protein